jgi:hypothetical protein
VKFLGIIRRVTFSFFQHRRSAGAISKLEYAPVAWDSVTVTDPNKLERVKTKFAALCHSKLFQDVEYRYGNILEKLNLLTLRARRLHFDVFFFFG